VELVQQVIRYSRKPWRCCHEALEDIYTSRFIYYLIKLKMKQSQTPTQVKEFSLKNPHGKVDSENILGLHRPRSKMLD
jgi:hypothetical protein